MTFHPASRFLSSTPLGALDLIVLDTETTGLDVSLARVIEIGAVRIKAGEIDTSNSFSEMVNPGVKIPSDSTKIHNITDNDVKASKEFAAVMDQFSTWAGPTVVVGFSIGYDLAILKAEHERHNLAWQAPLSLDVRHLINTINPELPGDSLETSADWLGIRVKNRHRALGDAELTAKIFQALIPKLQDLGITTLATAGRASSKQSSRLRQETEAGWHEVTADNQSLPSGVAEFARIDSFPYRHRVSEIMSTPPLTTRNDTTLQDALSKMMEEKVSSLFLPPTEADDNYGIITERDILRAIDTSGSKALAATAGKFAIRPLQTIDRDAFVYRAMLKMSANDFRHLGVTDQTGLLSGALSQRDLLRQRASDALSLGDKILSAQTAAQLGQIWPELTTVARGLVHEKVGPHEIAAVISHELRSLTSRACQIAEEELAKAGKGKPPQPYCMLVLGSGGRGESLLAMDQDNAIIFENGDPGGKADRWFEQLAIRVSDILNDAGVVYCTGKVMASNPAWRMSRENWRGEVTKWIARSRPEDILSSDIFFDAFPVYGDKQLGAKLRQECLAIANSAKNFLKLLALRASDFTTPLGWFGRFKTDKGRLDLKMGGILPIFSAARVVALRNGISARSTPSRLGAVQKAENVTPGLTSDLIEAHRILLDTVLRQQLRDLEKGIRLSSSIIPGELNHYQKDELKWALQQVSKLAGLLDVPVVGQ